MVNPLKVVIAGCSGRMGHALLEGVFADVELVLHGSLDRAGNVQLGRDAGEQFGRVSGVKVVADIDEALKGADVLVDFTRPEASMTYLAACQKHKVKMIIGTTGFSVEEKQAIEAAAKQIAIVFAPNMSVGVTLLINLVEQAARVLNEGYDIEDIEQMPETEVEEPEMTTPPQVAGNGEENNLQQS